MSKESKREQNLHVFFLYFIYRIFKNTFPHHFITVTLTTAYSGKSVLAERERESKNQIRNFKF